VKVDEDLETELARPVDSLVEVTSSTLNVRSSGVVVRPVADWDANQVEARVANLLHITVLNPVVPVRIKGSAGIGVVGVLTKSVFIDNAHRVWEHLEDAWRDLRTVVSDCCDVRCAGVRILCSLCRYRVSQSCTYPRLEDQPSSKVDTTNDLVTPVETSWSWTAFAERSGAVRLLAMCDCGEGSRMVRHTSAQREQPLRKARRGRR